MQLRCAVTLIHSADCTGWPGTDLSLMFLNEAQPIQVQKKHTHAVRSPSIRAKHKKPGVLVVGDPLSDPLFFVLKAKFKQGKVLFLKGKDKCQNVPDVPC